MKLPKIHLKEDTLNDLMAENDTNKTGLVVLTGISSSQLYRVSKTGIVGDDVVARILAANPKKKFEDYFFVQ
ncbi:MAG TPA: hypothetical protein DDW65_21495 [Firmicutes bacterium]|nr:hypothetical protein [Bacillota bacterium]